jgi:glucosamine-phosphate N-acetyltransferase
MTTYSETFGAIQKNGHQHLLVIEVNGKIVGAGSIMIEQKFIHGCGKVQYLIQTGHIEDIVVCDSLRGKGLGKLLILKLTEIGKSLGCYKVDT